MEQANSIQDKLKWRWVRTSWHTRVCHSCYIKGKIRFLSLPYFRRQAVFKEKQVNQKGGTCRFWNCCLDCCCQCSEALMALSSFPWGPDPHPQALFKLSPQPILCLGWWESSSVAVPVPCLAVGPAEPWGLCPWPDPHMQSNCLVWPWTCVTTLGLPDGLLAEPAQPPFSEVQYMLQLCSQHTAEMSNYLIFLALAMCLLMKLDALLISLWDMGGWFEELNRTSDLW